MSPNSVAPSGEKRGPFYYSAKRNEPAVVVELFLPKRIELQGVLYDALRDGFRLEHIKGYFRSLNQAGSEELKRRVREFAAGCWTVTDEWLTNDEIDQFPRLFFGYSLYEVDGVFLKRVEHAADDPDANWIPQEERTQVVRMIFKYTCADQDLETIDFAKAMLRDPLSDLAPFEQNYPDLAGRMSPRTKQALQPLVQWMRCVSFFLYGYLLYRICDAIVKQYSQHHQPDHGLDAYLEAMKTIKQDQIWVTSSWSLNVGVIEWSRSD